MHLSGLFVYNILNGINCADDDDAADAVDLLALRFIYHMTMILMTDFQNVLPPFANIICLNVFIPVLDVERARSIQSVFPYPEEFFLIRFLLTFKVLV